MSFYLPPFEHYYDTERVREKGLPIAHLSTPQIVTIIQQAVKRLVFMEFQGILPIVGNLDEFKNPGRKLEKHNNV